MGSLSPILSSSGSPHAANRSPAGIKRRPASFHARTPRTPRPNDLKVTPFSRMLNTPTSVDSLPRLRRFNSSQTQLSSFAYLGHDEGPDGTKSQEAQDGRENAQDKEETVATKSAGTPQPSAAEAVKEKDGGREEGGKQAEQARSKEDAKQTRTSEVLCQPVSDSRLKGDPKDRKDLVEVPLSDLKPSGEPAAAQEMTGEGEVEGEAAGDEQKMCCGFFFKVGGAAGSSEE